MSRIRLKKVDQISRKTVSDARDSFLRHCQLKNLAPHTCTYYKGNLQFFFDSAPQVKFVDPPEGYEKWTLRLLADKCVELNYAESLSHMTVSRILKKRI